MGNAIRFTANASLNLSVLGSLHNARQQATGNKEQKNLKIYFLELRLLKSTINIRKFGLVGSCRYRVIMYVLRHIGGNNFLFLISVPCSYCLSPGIVQRPLRFREQFSCYKRNRNECKQNRPKCASRPQACFILNIFNTKIF